MTVEWKALPSRVNMTRDAKLVTAKQLAEQNNANLQKLATPNPLTGAQAIIDPSAFVERRMQALVLMLLDDDGQAELELRYQEMLAEALDGAAGHIADAQRAARLSDISQAAFAAADPAALPNGHR